MKKTKLGQALIEAANEALEVERSNKRVRQTKIVVIDPPEWTQKRIIKLRKEWDVSQAIFARLLNVNKKTVESWEQGINKPGGPSQRLLQIFEDTPQEIIESIVIEKKNKNQRSVEKTKQHFKHGLINF
ncbi:MAG: hypothetical protein KDK51_03310 [Deltaproteobacteria bacterium]|nr:hypothetical protein [Deltaproteobacteria bacterium]